MRLPLKALIILYVAPLYGRPLTISTPDWPPFYIQESPDESKRGLAWDVLKICARRVDNAPTFEQYPIRRMFKYMERGELDVNIMSFKPDRVKTLDYGREIVFENSYSVWTRANLPTRIQRLDDLNGLNVGLLVGLKPNDQYRAWLDNRLRSKIDKETLILNEQEQIIKMLATDRIDATIASSPEFRWRGKKLGLSSKIKETNLVLIRQPYFLVVAKESPLYKANPQILKTMDQCVAGLRRDGTWLALKNLYDR